MPLPLVPIVAYGSLAAAAVLAVRRIEVLPVQQPHEDALDDLPEGVSVNRAQDREQMNSAARYRRVVRLGDTGPAFEIDASVLARIRVRRVS